MEGPFVSHFTAAFLFFFLIGELKKKTWFTEHAFKLDELESHVNFHALAVDLG